MSLPPSLEKTLTEFISGNLLDQMWILETKDLLPIIKKALTFYHPKYSNAKKLERWLKKDIFFEELHQYLKDMSPGHDKSFYIKEVASSKIFLFFIKEKKNQLIKEKKELKNQSDIYSYQSADDMDDMFECS